MTKQQKLSPEELDLLKDSGPSGPTPPKTKVEDQPKAEPFKEQPKDEANASEGEEARGDQSPAQYDDDGWGNTPVQMRGK